MTAQLSEPQDHHQHRGMTVKRTVKIRNYRSHEPHALLDDRIFANELINADLRLLLKIIVYLRSEC